MFRNTYGLSFLYDGLILLKIIYDWIIVNVIIEMSFLLWSWLSYRIFFTFSKICDISKDSAIRFRSFASFFLTPFIFFDIVFY